MPVRPTYELGQSPLFHLASRKKLAELLRVTPPQLRTLEERPARYQEFEIARKNGIGVRLVENPCRDLKLAQAKIARLLGRITPPEFLYCPVKRRCYVSNAARHRDGRVIQCLDVAKYFPSTPQRRVFWFFHKVMRCKRDIAALLAKLACHNGHLPTGSPLSPIMAFYAFYDLWSDIGDFCRDRGYVLSVYIDDITISGHRVPTRDIWLVRKKIHGAGLRAHKAKTYIDRAAEVTGVIVRDGKLMAPFRQHKKRHEAKKQLVGAANEQKAALLGQLAGLEGQINQITKMNPAPT